MNEKVEVKEAYKIMQKASGIKVGDRVRLLRKVSGEGEMGWHEGWCGDMSDRVGKIGTVIDVRDHTIDVNIQASHFTYPFFVLEVVEPAKEEKMITVAGKEYSESTLTRAMKEYVLQEYVVPNW